jgi:glycosyltransferase involved in cell wall biosynthesis
MPEISASSDLCVIPMVASGTQEGFPSKIYSIMGSARPVLVLGDTDSELASLVHQASCGQVVPTGDHRAFADAIRKACGERDRLAAEGRRGRDFVELEYSKEAVAKKYNALICRLTRKREAAR